LGPQFWRKRVVREWRSPRPPPRRALQSPVYIRKKVVANKREKEKRKNFKELNLNALTGVLKSVWTCPMRALKNPNGS